MSHQITGVVDSCSTRDQKTRNGVGQIHSCTVDGVTFETGFQKKFSEGEQINVEVKWDYGKWNYVKNGGDGLPKAENKQKFAGGGGSKNFGGGSRGRGSFPVDPKDGSISIIRQNSLTHATKIVENMCTTSSAVGKDLFIPKDDQEYLTKVLEVALILTDFSSGQDIMKMKAAAEANMEAYNNG